MSYIIYGESMKYNPKNPAWCDRDRFVLSAGHGSMLQYSLLHLTGYDSVSVRPPLHRAPCLHMRRCRLPLRTQQTI